MGNHWLRDRRFRIAASGNDFGYFLGRERAVVNSFAIDIARQAVLVLRIDANAERMPILWDFYAAVAPSLRHGAQQAENRHTKDRSKPIHANGPLRTKGEVLIQPTMHILPQHVWQRNTALT
jgi:hypothetical protein